MTNWTTFGTMLKLAACAVGGALAAIVVVAGALLATLFAFLLVAAQILRPLGRLVPRAQQPDAEPARAPAVARTASA